ncbi:MAG: PD-(D/E)XK nuclease family protein [Bacteroidota bacterium]|nr:PD-(D/E)XK nuclease family protein [Bacteroidota bacterium]
MESFLYKVAIELVKNHDYKFNNVILVFPNKRSGLYLKNILIGKSSEKCFLMPEIYSIEEFITKLSGLIIPDNLTLLTKLFDIYEKHIETEESFDSFYAWGNMLLSDFDDIDKYLVNAQKLYSTIYDIKLIEQQFDLQVEDYDSYLEFWKTFSTKPLTNTKEAFAKIWSKLFIIYSDFRKALSESDLAYEGMAYRHLLEIPNAINEIIKSDKILYFCGFNALTKSENKIFKKFTDSGKAKCIWDADMYYLDDTNHEAGLFMRKNRNNFKNDFADFISDDLINREKTINFIATPYNVGIANALSICLKRAYIDDNLTLEKSAVILNDEKLLFPVLNSLPEFVDHMNITMGYPIIMSPVYSLIETLFLLHENCKNTNNNKSKFYHKYIIQLLQHPYIKSSDNRAIQKFINFVNKYNIIYADNELINNEFSDNEFIKGLFYSQENILDFFNYLKNILIEISKKQINNHLEKNDFQVNDNIIPEVEVVSGCYKLINRLEEIIINSNAKFDLKTIRKIFRQVVQTEKIPFKGEPLSGLQIMGFLESRNLDFDNIFILSMNEGLAPSVSKNNSYIPYNLRKSFGLSILEENNAIYSYNFYRLLQRAKNVYLIYNTIVGDGKNGEISRYILQLEYELARQNPEKIKINKKIIWHDIINKHTDAITVSKNGNVKDLLRKFVLEPGVENKKGLSPTAFADYLTCSLRFYFKYLIELNKPDELSDDVDAQVLGNLFHGCMEKIYSDMRGIKINKESITSLLDNKVDEIIKLIFSDYFNNSVDINNGKNLLIRNLLKEIIGKVLKNDIIQAEKESLIILETEKELRINLETNIDGNLINVKLKGFADRIDQIGNTTRIIDYKTGKVEIKSEKSFDIDDIIADKYKFQAMMYTFIYQKLKPEIENIKAAIISIRNIKDNIIYINQKPYSDIELNLFENKLKEIIYDIFSSSENRSFTQTENLKDCENCDYKGICNR